MKRLNPHNYILFLSMFAMAACASVPEPKPLRPGLDLQGHRGARGLKPENTWPAFQTAMEYGMDTLELDTVLTKDKEIVIHHDSDTNPQLCLTKEGVPVAKVPISSLTFSELQTYDCGTLKNPKFPEQSPVPGTKLLRLEEFFSLVLTEEKKIKRKLEFNVETKFPDDGSASDSLVEEHTKRLIQIIEKFKLEDRSTIQSFDLRTLVVAKKLNPKIKRSALFVPTYFQGFLMTIGFGDGFRDDILSKSKSVDANIISPYFLYVKPQFVNQAHANNQLVIPWTVNSKKEMRRLISSGVDGIISDYPNLLREVMKE